MAPYRDPPPPRCEPEIADAGDSGSERALGVLLLAIGMIRVAIALARNEVFRTGSTIALLMIAVAIGLLRHRR